MERRPTLDIDNLSSSRDLKDERRLRLKRIIRKFTKDDKAALHAVLHKFRRRQKKLLDGGYESDPDPYEETYVFYCLDTPRKD